MKREGDRTAYVFCSKTTPVVIAASDGAWLVTFLVRNDKGAYFHASETSLAKYFVVCHARAFGGALYEQGPVFAQSLGYSAKTREDQPKIDRPEIIFDLVK